jgi:hypothetical protein
MIAIVILASGIMFIIGGHLNLSMIRKDSDQMFTANEVADTVMHAVMSASWDELNDRTKPLAWLTWTRQVDPEDDGCANDDEWLGDRDSLAYDTNAMLVAGTTPETRRMLPARVRSDGTIEPLVTGLRGLRVYVEYYRAITATDAEGVRMSGPDGLPLVGGIMQGVATRSTTPGAILVTTMNVSDGSVNEAKTPQSLLGGSGLVSKIAGINRINRIETQTDVGQLLLPVAETIPSQSGQRIGESDPVAIRILVTWEDDSATPPATPISRLDYETRVSRRYIELYSIRRR